MLLYDLVVAVVKRMYAKPSNLVNEMLVSLIL